MFRCTHSFVCSGWSIQQQQRRGGGCVGVLVQQLGSWVQKGKLDNLHLPLKKQLNLFSWMQIFFDYIFGWHISIFVLWEMKEPKECLFWSQARQKNFSFFTLDFTIRGCWAEWVLAGHFTLLCHLLKHWWQTNICLFSTSCRVTWDNGRKVVMGRSFLKKTSAFFGGRCWVFSSVHTSTQGFCSTFCKAYLFIPEKHWFLLIVSLQNSNWQTGLLKRKLWKVVSFYKVFSSISSPIKPA